GARSPVCASCRGKGAWRTRTFPMANSRTWRLISCPCGNIAQISRIGECFCPGLRLTDGCRRLLAGRAVGLFGHLKPTRAAAARFWALRGHASDVGLRASRFDRVPAGGSDPEANDLDRLGASLHGLAFRSGKPGAHETGDHVAIKPMGAHKQCLGSAMRAAGEQL